MATKNLKQKIRNNGAFSLGEKATLEKVAEAVGEISVLDADVTRTSTTALAAITGYPTYELKAGRKYLIRARGGFTGTVNTGGLQLKFNLSGTQTSGIFSGVAAFSNADTGAVAAGTTCSLNASTVVANCTAGTMPAVGEYNMWQFIQPQNDGLLTFQFAQAAPSANTVTIKRGAILEKIDLE